MNQVVVLSSKLRHRELKWIVVVTANRRQSQDLVLESVVTTMLYLKC
jgi:hypothetical protein